MSAALLPVEFSLSQNYPNPFNPTTTIEYTLPFDVSHLSGEPAPIYRGGGDGSKSPMDQGDFSKVRLVIFDSLGRIISTLVNEQQKPGEYSVKFDGSGLPSGIYFYKLSGGRFEISRKMLLLKKHLQVYNLSGNLMERL